MGGKLSRKITLSFYICIASLCFVGSFLLIVLLSNIGIGIFKQSDFYQVIAYYPQINAEAIFVDDIDGISPIVSLPKGRLKTNKSSVEFDMISSEHLETEDFEWGLLTELDEKSREVTYVVTIRDLEIGINEISLVFSDLQGNEVSQTIEVEREQLYSYVAYTDNYEIVWENGNDLLAIVDKEYGLSSDYYPSDLVNIRANDIKTANSALNVRSIVIDDLSEMISDSKGDGVDLVVLSAYRSYYKQSSIYNSYLNTIGYVETERAVARAGHSEHQLGTTIDFATPEIGYVTSSAFGSSKAGIWIADNGYKYGFVMSYPEGSEPVTGYKYEPWHFRYVGKEAASEIHESGKIPDVYLREYHGIY